MVAGVPGFGFGHGEVFGVHVAWSGNTVHRVERVPSGLGMVPGQPAATGNGNQSGPGGRVLAGVTTIGGGELLLPGEITLAAGESYTTPWVYLAAGRDGLDSLSAQFHGYLRAQPAHPRSPRPVNLNVWEAVYFRHDFATLADTAARIGVERYVLDDGWFTGRRDDRAGLGDWQVDEAVWPGGLHRLVDYVRDRGLQFGLWIEPEMVNPDSDLYRAHPDWILSTGQRVPPLERHQLVLDLSRPEVSGYLFDQITVLLSEYPISCIKWDCNRDLIDAGSVPRAGAPAAHDQAVAVYALLDRLRERHPAVEWESCAAGGGRVDLAMLGRVQRIWGHHPGQPGGTGRPCRLDRAVQGAPGAHPQRPHGPARHPGRHRLDARGRRRRPVGRPDELCAAGRAPQRPAGRPARPGARPGAPLPGH